MHDATVDRKHGHTHSQNRFAVIPTAEKLDADPRHTGRGVTIAFLDSGFYPHPDFADRVVAFHDVTGAENSLAGISTPSGHHWHGTQTVVSCAGDGRLSDGVYRGIATSAKLVLVKVSDNGRISDASIEKGLRWVIKNRERFNIRILNMSLGGDADLPTHESSVNRLTEQLVASGVVVTVAAGNSSQSCSIPPANAPSVITVGGYSDENQFTTDNFDLYHSSFGFTADGIVKPEIIAPAMYVAAPILPDTDDYAAAEELSMLAAAPDYEFRRMLSEKRQIAGLDSGIAHLPIEAARQIVESSIGRRKIVATHYQHVDGTSFAAPITASVAAQMIEANQKLNPAAIKNILISTACKLAGRPSIRQGFGILNARLAVEFAEKEIHSLEPENHHPPRIDRTEIVFSYHNDNAVTVDLWSDLNDWSSGVTPFMRTEHGPWRASIRCQPSGKYRYKFLIDDTVWSEDPSHGFKEEDGLGGFNSILIVD